MSTKPTPGHKPTGPSHPHDPDPAPEHEPGREPGSGHGHKRGSRSGEEIMADLDAANKELRELHLERDKLQARADKDAKLLDGQRKLAEGQHKAAGLEFVESEWLESQKPPYTVPAELNAAFHKQHYVVAALERELAAAGLTPGSVAGGKG